MFCFWLVTEFPDLTLVIKVWQAFYKYLVSECMNEWCFYNYFSPLIETLLHFLSSQYLEFSLPYFTSYLLVFILPSPNQTIRDNFLKGSTTVYACYITSIRIAEFMTHGTPKIVFYIDWKLGVLRDKQFTLLPSPSLHFAPSHKMLFGWIV